MSHNLSPTPNVYRPELNAHTNVTDYEKVRRIPKDRFSPTNNDVGLYEDNRKTRGTPSGYTSPYRRTNDPQMSYQLAAGERTPTQNLALNIPTKDEQNTSPTSNLSPALSRYQRRKSSPLNPASLNKLEDDPRYSQTRSYNPVFAGDRRDTIFPEEDNVFKAMLPEDDHQLGGSHSEGYRSLPYSSYTLPTQSRAVKINPMDSLSRYSTNTSSSLSQLRKSHQELTSEGMTHHYHSLSGDQPSYHTLTPSRDYQKNGLDTNRHSHSTSDLVSARPAISGDLSKWQQLHQQQLALQKADTKALSSLNTKSASLNSLHGNYEPLSVPSMYSDHDRIGAFKNVADGIIQEKDKVIEDLRLQLLQLEGGSYGSSYSPLPHRSFQTGSDISQLKTHAQDLEYQNALLKNKLEEISKSQKSKIDSLELQLGATEHELLSVKTDFSQKQKMSRYESAEVESKIKEKENEIEEWHRRFVEIRDDRMEVKKKLDDLQRYLADLPTSEDALQTNQKVSNLEAEVSTKQTTIENLERKVMKAKKIITGQEMEFKRLVEQNSQLNSKLTELQEEIHTIKSNGLGEQLGQAQAEVQQLKRDKERVRIDLEKSKKMLEDRHRLTKQVEVRHKLEVTRLEERLSQEESAVNALREEITQKDDHIRKLKLSIKELSAQNQDLLEQTMIQKESLSKFERHCTDESQKLERQLAREMRQCFSQLQAVVRVCVDRADGQDPDMSLLLGTRAMQEVESDEEYSQSSQSGSSQASSTGSRGSLSDALTLKHRLSKVSSLRKDIEKLRDLISNKIAEDLGQKIECAMQ